MAFMAVALAACVTDNRPESCDADAVTLQVAIRADGMVPSDPAACIGQDVTLRLVPEVDGVFHIHGLDELVPATTIASGEEVELEFSADRTGQFPVELHRADDAQGVHIGVLALYDR